MVQDTEWDDILREKGIIGPKQDADEKQAPYIRSSQQRTGYVGGHGSRDDTDASRHEDQSDSELDSLLSNDDDDGEDEFMAKYRQQRLMEMQQEQYGRQQRSAQGSSTRQDLSEITRQDFVQMVTRAPKDQLVIVCLYKTGLPQSDLMVRILQQLADGERGDGVNMAFYNIKHDDCIPNYPDRNVPTLFFYLNGDLLVQKVNHQIPGLSIPSGRASQPQLDDDQFEMLCQTIDCLFSQWCSQYKSLLKK
ncbi:hypothetical protein MIR68_006045 [Amoeboaphelidium protococcarum]|nr:hypothetical protein MIR68_006045 [Amoeboaphelidium protococcarum]